MRAPCNGSMYTRDHPKASGDHPQAFGDTRQSGLRRASSPGNISRNIKKVPHRARARQHPLTQGTHRFCLEGPSKGREVEDKDRSECALRRWVSRGVHRTWVRPFRIRSRHFFVHDAIQVHLHRRLVLRLPLRFHPCPPPPSPAPLPLPPPSPAVPFLSCAPSPIPSSCTSPGRRLTTRHRWGGVWGGGVLPCANNGAPRTRKRHQQEHRPERPTERSNPTQHAEGRTGDCPGPRKETATRRNVTQGGVPPTTHPPCTPLAPPQDWAKISSGPLAHQKSSSAPLKTQHHLGGGEGDAVWIPNVLTTADGETEMAGAGQECCRK